MLKISIFYIILSITMAGLFTIDKKVKCDNIDTSKLKSIDHVICRRLK
jgi:uncharacterized membrane protein